MKNRVKWNYNLWLTFALSVIAIYFFIFVLFGAVAFFLLKPSIPSGQRLSFWTPFVIFIVAGFIAATVLTLWVSSRLLEPMEHLSEALDLIASGNFTIRLPEDPSLSQVYRTNRNFNKMAKELSSIQMLQSDFIQNVSHEIKTPLAAIEGYAALLQEACLPEELNTYASRITESTRQLAALTGNVLKLSRLEKQEIITEKEYFSLDEQLREALLSLEPLWSKKELEIDIDIPSVNYFGNTGLLCQVWTNLFSNAIKFTPTGGSIHVVMEENSGGITVKIHDTGIGMTEDIQKHIFEKFFQGEKSHCLEGNGLGLPLVKKIVDLCEGTVEVTSKPGHGSTFSVWLPPAGSAPKH